MSENSVNSFVELQLRREEAVRNDIKKRGYTVENRTH